MLPISGRRFSDFAATDPDDQPVAIELPIEWSCISVTAPFAPIALRRRSALERRALAMLRGEEQPVQSREDTSAGDVSRQATKSQAMFFAELRRMAARHGITVQSPGTRFVGDGELMLLAWIAQEQRITRHACAMPADRSCSRPSPAALACWTRWGCI